MRAWPLALILTVCTACGVGPTDVIRAGEAPRGFVQGTSLYFVRHGRLVPVTRPEGPLPAAEAVVLLTGGPTSGERERGFDTGLPKGLVVRATGDAFVLGAPASRLPRMATGQLVCTIAAATAVERGVQVDDVRVTVPGKGQARCADFT
ncbi:hypothetical protein [Nonomuraea sp. NPDC001831]|uniref:hypothetical protein n=1 Tax=Nonomuraea sp. NPDC001831 TaxID=3364340 RepID=UPI0036A47B23